MAKNDSSSKVKEKRSNSNNESSSYTEIPKKTKGSQQSRLQSSGSAYNKQRSDQGSMDYLQTQSGPLPRKMSPAAQ